MFHAVTGLNAVPDALAENSTERPGSAGFFGILAGFFVLKRP
jgi:hypothetical protein